VVLGPAARDAATDAVAAEVRTAARDIDRRLAELAAERADLDQVLIAAGRPRLGANGRGNSSWFAPAPFIGLAQAPPITSRADEEPREQQSSLRRLGGRLRNRRRDADEAP
jgi:hypothetical protein